MKKKTNYWKLATIIFAIAVLSILILYSKNQLQPNEKLEYKYWACSGRDTYLLLQNKNPCDYNQLAETFNQRYGLNKKIAHCLSFTCK
jgi:hypothetical protein